LNIETPALGEDPTPVSMRLPQIAHLRRLETALAVAGLLMSVAVFLAQGPYDRAWKYMIVALPMVVVAIVILARPALRRFQRFGRAMIHAKEAFDWIMGTKIESTFTVRIQNTKGDLLYERWFRLEVLKNGVVEDRTKQDLVGAEVPIPGFPPNAIVNSSRPHGVTLTPRDVVMFKTVRGQHDHFDYRWAYEIQPALRNRGDYVEYSYSSLIPKCEAKAFTEGGALFFFLHDSIALDVLYSLFAPPRYRIHIVEAWIEDADRRRNDLPKEDWPTLSHGDQVMSWQPTYRKKHSYIARYRLLPAGASGP
jgi:hypothetical protein